MRFVGIDPGQAGAVVVLGDDGRTALDHRWWSQCKNPPRIAAQLVSPGDVVVIEGLYVGLNRQTAMTLSEWVGWLRCLMPDSIALLRPTAGEWRGKVFPRGLRNPRMRRAEAKRIAIRLCRRESGLRDAIASRPDVAEAWCMARFGWGAHRAGRALAEPREITDRSVYSRSA